MISMSEVGLSPFTPAPMLPRYCLAARPGLRSSSSLIADSRAASSVRYSSEYGKSLGSANRPSSFTSAVNSAAARCSASSPASRALTRFPAASLRSFFTSGSCCCSCSYCSCSRSRASSSIILTPYSVRLANTITRPGCQPQPPDTSCGLDSTRHHELPPSTDTIRPGNSCVFMSTGIVIRNSSRVTYLRLLLSLTWSVSLRTTSQLNTLCSVAPSTRMVAFSGYFMTSAFCTIYQSL